MTRELHHPDGRVLLDLGEKGECHVGVEMRKPSAFCSEHECVTSYPAELIEAILQVKGPAYLCDEIKRDEDPAYVQDRLENEIGYFIDLRELNGKRILDFGCGGGASTFCLARLVKNAEIVGVELDRELLSIAEARKKFYGCCGGCDTPVVTGVLAGRDAEKMPPWTAATTTRAFLSTNTRFLLSPSGTSLPEGLGTFDFIVLSAVYEHLLPEERKPVLAMLWAALRPGGILFINQTPNRWFPVEQHTTGLPLLNYLSDRLASSAARKWSKRGLATDDWPTLLRKGIRGGSERGIAHALTMGGAHDAEVMRPVRVGARDGIDLWFRMSSPRFRMAKRMLRGLFRCFARITGIYLVPAFIVMAVRKGSISCEVKAPSL